MRQPLVDFISRVQTAPTVDDVRNIIIEWSRDLGFQRVVYANYKLDQETPRLFMGSYQDSWVERYLDQNYIQIDPVARLSGSSVLPFRWGHTEFRNRLSRSERQMFDEADDFGISRGFAIPVHGPGGELSVLSLATNELDRGFHKLVDMSQDMLHLSCCYLHQRISELLDAPEEANEAARIQLSPREVECLLWSSSGKTANETSDILHISETTVIYHLENAKKKLGVRTKAHAVAKALNLGLIPTM